MHQKKVYQSVSSLRAINTRKPNTRYFTMERWTGRVALVTGASSGIGAAIAKELVLKGMKVIGVARRVERIEEYQDELKGASGKLYPLACDVSKETDILAAFEWATKNLGGVDVLVNNAGLGPVNSDLVRSKTENWRTILDVNVLGLSICSREAIKSMQSRGVDDGHIFNIGSVCGHRVIDFPGIGMYSASKFAVTALSEALKKELVALNSRIKVTHISPGAVKTEIMIAGGFAPDMSAFDHIPFLESKDIADALVFILGTPAHVQIHELTIQPVGEKL